MLLAQATGYGRKDGSSTSEYVSNCLVDRRMLTGAVGWLVLKGFFLLVVLEKGLNKSLLADISLVSSKLTSRLKATSNFQNHRIGLISRLCMNQQQKKKNLAPPSTPKPTVPDSYEE
ncbi:unnamed protein product [Citrullus colocynthis]|uniref:Uncharacterized protein n=1 Tax=Citrullus colocynthis TaxID=252529 RepID=A0ABP0YY62_9ROSI